MRGKKRDSAATKAAKTRAMRRGREELIWAEIEIEDATKYVVDHARFATRLGAYSVAADYMDAFWILKGAVDCIRDEMGVWPVGGIKLTDMSGRH